MEKCNRDCLNCVLEKCIDDMQISLNLPPKTRDRKGYYKEYYRAKKEGKKVQRVTNKQYVKYIDVRNKVAGLKKQIGEVNYNLVMDALNEIERG